MSLDIKNIPAWDVGDFTTFLSPDDTRRLDLDSPAAKEFGDCDRLHLDDEVTFSRSGSVVGGRGLACWCCNRQAVSITVRKKYSSGGSRATYNFKRKAGVRSTWHLDHTKKDTRQLCEFFYEAVLAPRTPPTGVLAFFGETGSRKSTYARGLIDIYLDRLATSNCGERRPHLLTFEDPIEDFFSPEDGEAGTANAFQNLRRTAKELAVDYTPRCIGVDTPSLQAGLLNALRQKPAVVYVGETRTREDWRSVLDFGGTGHLIVTTSHAGSLLESMSQLFKVAEATSPAQRSFVAGKVLAVVHLRAYGSGEEKVVIPAMWRRTPEGANNLVTDGIGSILPNNPGVQVELPAEGSLGRHWFGKYLKKAVRRSSIEDSLLEQLLLDDLQGL